jgi:aminopeptidase N
MENWGLITYRETDLLVNPTDSGVVDMRNVAMTVAHEMAHLVSASRPPAE